MPELPNFKPDVRQYYLPSSAVDDSGSPVPQENQAWVKIDFGPSLAGELLIHSDDENMDAHFLRWLSVRIKEWNYTDHGQPVAINFETVGRLDTADFRYLFTKYVEFIQSKSAAPAPEVPLEEKKASSGTSSPSEPPATTTENG